MSIDALYTAMAGLQAANAQMAALSSNLANAQTTGYAAVQAATEAAPYQGTSAPGGADVVALSAGPDTQAGALTHTNDPMNLGFGGDAWMEVQTPSGVALTRDGMLQVTNAGILADSAGNAVLDPNGQPISLPRLANMQIGPDGTISGVPAGQAGGPSQSYDQIYLVGTPQAPMTALGGSLFQPGAGAALQPAQNGSVSQGYLNASNVNVTQAMMELIDTSRSYQMQTDLLKTQSGTNQQLNTLLSQG